MVPETGVSSLSLQVPGVQHLITCVSMSGLGNMKGAWMDGWIKGYWLSKRHVVET
jgi:hypothetical protein